MPPPATPPPFTLDMGTGFSLALAFSFMPAAQIIASFVLPKTISRKLFWIFVWLIYDFLTHSIIEGSYLYHCFYSFETISINSDHPHPASLGSKGPFFLGYADRNYGSYYSTGPMARLWQEYAKADNRWGGSDVTIISLELLTVFLVGPAAAYSAYLIAKISNATDSTVRGKFEAKMWFSLIFLSVCELYGGWVTFCPEWLSGNSSLSTDDPVYLWLYLVFFNMLWVFIPAWILYEGYNELRNAFVHGTKTDHLKKLA